MITLNVFPLSCPTKFLTFSRKIIFGFLTLKIMDIHDCLEPSENALKIWQYHILHTKRYLTDCDLIFGKTIFIDEKLLKNNTKLQ